MAIEKQAIKPKIETDIFSNDGKHWMISVNFVEACDRLFSTKLKPTFIMASLDRLETFPKP